MLKHTTPKLLKLLFLAAFWVLFGSRANLEAHTTNDPERVVHACELASVSTDLPQFKIEERHYARVARINERRDPKLSRHIYARLDPVHGTVIVSPDGGHPPADAKAQFLAFHGSGSSNSNANTMATVGEMMAGKGSGKSGREVTQYSGYFQTIFEAPDQATCGGGLDENKQFLEGGGPSADEITDFATQVKWVVSLARERKARNPGLPLFLLTRSSSAMFAVGAAIALKGQGIIDGLILTSPTLPGTEEIDRQRIADGAKVLYELAAQGKFSVHEPSLKWIDRLLTQTAWSEDMFADLDVLIITGDKDAEVVPYERARYEAIAKANSSVRYINLPHMEHNVFDTALPYGVAAYHAMYDFMNDVLWKRRDPEGYQRYQEELMHRRESATQDLLNRYGEEAEAGQASPLRAFALPHLDTVAIAPRDMPNIASSTAQMVLLHDIGNDNGHLESLVPLMRTLMKTNPDWRLETLNLPGAISHASPDLKDFRSVYVVAEWLEKYLQAKKAEAPHLPLVVHAVGTSSLFAAALNKAIADSGVLIDALILDNPLFPNSGDKAMLALEAHLSDRQELQDGRAQVAFSWLKDRVREIEWGPEYFGPQFRKPNDAAAKANFHVITLWQQWLADKGLPTVTLILSGLGHNGITVPDRKSLEGFGNVERPNVMTYNIPEAGRGSFSETDSPVWNTFTHKLVTSFVTGIRTFSKFEFRKAHIAPAVKKQP